MSPKRLSRDPLATEEEVVREREYNRRMNAKLKSDPSRDPDPFAFDDVAPSLPGHSLGGEVDAPPLLGDGPLF